MVLASLLYHISPVIFLYLVIFIKVSSQQQYDLSNPAADKCQTRSCYPVTGNLLLGRESRLKASSTCGLHVPESYCIVSHLEDRKKCFRCDSRHPWMRHINEKSHRIENVITDRLDERMKKWWQSENGVQNVSIQLNLEAEFHFTHLIMTFKSFRPAAMLVERSSDYGKSWRVYRYFAYDCNDSFRFIHEASSPRRHDDVICDSRYSKVEPSTGGEVVFKVLSPHIPTSDPFAPEIQDLLRITNLRINFTKLHTLGDNLLDNRREISEKYYYAIYDMVVRGSCSCYGHAEHCIPADFNGRQGVSFINGKGDFGKAHMIHGRCQCQHHTKGMNCEECEDFFNDVPWKPAVDREINACRPCECNGHATRCHFDKSVYEASNFVSGGVCDDCQHNTVGKNCEQCKPYYYREPGRQINDPYACRSCECDPIGSSNQGICDSETDPEHNLVAGKCHCKMNVDGERCDRCKNGFWNMDKNSTEGCKACTCFLLGTYGNEGCNKITGECTCKRLVTGENCDRCLPEHYGLSEHIEGCKPCDCDLGGALNNNCNVTTGDCTCRPNFTGRRCDQPTSGFYCVHLDHYTLEAENAYLIAGATAEQREPLPVDARSVQTWTGTGFSKLREGGEMEFTIVNVSQAMKYHFVIRFESHLAEAWENVALVLIRPAPPSAEGACRDALPLNDFMRLMLSPGGRYYEVPEPVCLEPNVTYKVKLTMGEYKTNSNERGATVLIDSLVLAPATDDLGIFNGTNNFRKRQEYEHYQCRQSALDLAARERLFREPCSRFICPLAASLLESADKCHCDLTGSTSTICEARGGNCPCKPNVQGRRCDRCAPGTYGFGPQGCTACECNSVGSLDNFCDSNNGQCKCREGVYGKQCDQCQPGYWGFPSCRQCQCNGHADLCDQETGACINCRNLTTSYYCDRCHDGYYGDPRIGINIPCRSCPCPGGPGSGYQHADTCYLDPPTQNVVCNCKPGYVGLRCDKCVGNYWGTPAEIGGSCDRCDCNNNIDFSVPESCDPKTGRCTKCLHNTEGFHCEHCVAGFFGDAKMQQCSKCICNELGTNKTDEVCDRNSGQCPCLPNVIDLRCDTCAPLHWKLSSGAGCEMCGCDPKGVLTVESSGEPQLQCNEFDGQCACKQGRGGRTCSECQDYYWGDPTKHECKKCECNPSGSVTLQCHRDNGTCICQSGTGGPRCDQCARGYTGVWPHCSPCGECFQNWDKVLTNLTNETEHLAKQASNIELTGVGSVYDAEFKVMEQKLANVTEQLSRANLTRTEIDTLSNKALQIEKLIEEARQHSGAVDQRSTELSGRADIARQSASALRDDARILSQQADEFERNATRLRESDVEGAWNVTKEAQREVNIARERAQGAAQRASASEAARRRAADQMAAYGQEFEEQFKGNDATLNELDSDIMSLLKKIPALNSDICGVAADPCDDLCGGAMCGKCGGPSCAEGAVTKAELAYQYAKEAREKLDNKQRQAYDLAQSLRQANQAAYKARREALEAYETALHNVGALNATRQNMRQKLTGGAKICADSDASSFDQIRALADQVLTLDTSNSSEIEAKKQEINELLTKTTKIDEILAETSLNSTIAKQLKERALEAKNKADSIYNTSKFVDDALNKSKEAQEKTKISVDQANYENNNTKADLAALLNEIESALNATQESERSVALLHDALSGVEVDYLQADKDADRARQILDIAKRRLHEAESRRDALNAQFENIGRQLQDEAGVGKLRLDKDKERTERLKQRATALLEKFQQIKQDAEQSIKTHMNDNAKLTSLEDSFEQKLRLMDQYTADIQKRYDHYEKCS